jgi:hypothetical protein
MLGCPHLLEGSPVGAEIVLAIYVVAGLGLLGLAVLLYLRATASRTVYRCPKCNEVVSVELMQASRCNVCGAPLSYPDDYRTDREDDRYGASP